jgi:hypothetical protein
MAITEVPPDGDRSDDATDLHIEPTPARSSNTSGPPSKPNGGGPKTREGKEKSSRNATKLGIFSKSPIVGDERIEDWDERVQGLRDSFQPSGYLEESIVYEMALNRQHKERLDRSMNAIVQHQFDTANALERISGVADFLEHPADEFVAYRDDPKAAQPIMDAIIDGEAIATFSGYELSMFFSALSIACDIDTAKIPGFADAIFEEWTIQAVRKSLDVVAESCGHDSEWVILRTMGEITRADLKRRSKDRQDARDRQLELAQALLPPTPELEKFMRYEKTLENQFDKLIHRFEIAQRARSGALPPPIRFDIQEN